jgi:hypothetical protein
MWWRVRTHAAAAWVMLASQNRRGMLGGGRMKVKSAGV